jgi:hypothetical protein
MFPPPYAVTTKATIADVLSVVVTVPQVSVVALLVVPDDGVPSSIDDVAAPPKRNTEIAYQVPVDWVQVIMSGLLVVAMVA